MNNEIPSVGLSLIILSLPKQYMLIMKKSKQKNIQNIHDHILPNLRNTLDSFQLMSEHNI